ncbi:GIY-YIG nuclease family protein [Tenacibaculum sp. TC6]|uniref:GIY-YIG nuclease family protein n=1 Tax=Tenacibaculum sp. TC6 TaxID=3423223 RepID=UPI003D3624E0
MKKGYVYFLTNKNNTVIYIGVTSNLKKRIYQHKIKFYKGFTSKYNCDKLIYFEEFDTIKEAVLREKQLKKGNRKRKENLIIEKNPLWEDLSEDWLFDIKD